MAQTSTQGHRSTYRHVLAQSCFRVLFLTRSLAVTGDSVRALALAVLVFKETRSPLLAAIAYSIAFFPQLLGSALLGSLADRLRPRPLLAILYVTDACTGIVIGASHPPVAVSLTLVAAVALVTPLYQGASSRLVADVLSGDDYVKGRALWCSAPLAAQLAGNAIAGGLITVFGAPLTILLSSIFHLSATAMIRFGLPDLPAAPAAADDGAARRGWRSTFSASWIQSFRILRERSVRRLLLAKWIPPGLVAGAEALIVPYASRHGYPASLPGILLGCLALGMMVSNLIFGHVNGAELRERLTVPLTLVAGLPLIALAVNPPILVTGLVFTITGIGLSYDLGLELRFVDAVPPDQRGLAFGLRSTGLMTVQGIGPALAGALALALPVPRVMAVTGALTAVLGVILVMRALGGRPGATEAEASYCQQPDSAHAPVSGNDPGLADSDSGGARRTVV
jgi:MFS family permease